MPREVSLAFAPPPGLRLSVSTPSQTLFGGNVCFPWTRFSHDGTEVIRPYAGRGIEFWDAATGRLRRVLASGVELSPAGDVYVVNNYDKTLSLRGVVTGQERHRLQHEGDVYTITFSPDGKALATGGTEGVLRLWDIATGTARLLAMPKEPIFDIVFTPDSTHLVYGQANNVRVVLNVETGTEVRRFTGTRPVFRPDSKMMALQEGSGSVTLYDVADGQEVRRFQEVDKPLVMVGWPFFSPDGQLLARADGDRAIRFWDTATGQLRATFRGYNAVSTSMAFSPDGKTLATNSVDQTTKLWNLDVILRRRGTDGLAQAPL